MIYLLLRFYIQLHDDKVYRTAHYSLVESKKDWTISDKQN